MRKTASNPQSSQAETELRRLQHEIEEAERELARLEAQRRNFEARVEKRLGSLADQLVALETEIQALELAVEHKRNEMLFGKKHGFQEPDYWRNWTEGPADDIETPAAQIPEEQEPKIREVYRQLARKYHPDLALDDSDLAFRNEMMTVVNRAFAAGSLAELKALALGSKLPRDVPENLAPGRTTQNPVEKEVEAARRRLRDLRGKIQRHPQHPSVQLSLNITLARAEGRDLLAEMARELRNKIAHKAAQRDFLKSQLAALAE